jgi:hypothetical protein
MRQNTQKRISARLALVAVACLFAVPAMADSVYMVPGPIALVPLDVAAVTTGGVAVTALAAGHRNKGGWILNPPGSTVSLCVNEIATAAGTSSAGSLTCVAPGQGYHLAPSPNAVSVVTTDSAHAFSGYGWN